MWGSGNEAGVASSIKPEALKEAVSPLETKRAASNQFEFVVKAFDKAATGTAMKIVGNYVKMSVEQIDK